MVNEIRMIVVLLLQHCVKSATIIPNLTDIDPFHGGVLAFRLGAGRSAVWGTGQGPLRGRKANTPHRRPPSFVRRRRCGLLVVHAPRRNPRLSDGQNLGGEMGQYQ